MNGKIYNLTKFNDKLQINYLPKHDSSQILSYIRDNDDFFLLKQFSNRKIELVKIIDINKINELITLLKQYKI